MRAFQQACESDVRSKPSGLIRSASAPGVDSTGAGVPPCVVNTEVLSAKLHSGASMHARAITVALTHWRQPVWYAHREGARSARVNLFGLSRSRRYE